VDGFRIGSLALGKLGYIAACLAAAVVLVGSGYAHSVLAAASALAGGADLGGNVSPAAAQNILLMGLESRTDFQGHPLTAQEFTETHAGKAGSAASQGSQATDTLILIHVFAGGQRAVGYSIPRDDVVSFPHTVTVNGAVITEGKIDGAYADAYNQYVAQNIGTMGSTPALYTGANQAGQLFETQTVESVTGVHVDHFVVSNIIGFLHIAQQLGGISVCIAPAPASIEPGGEGFKGGSNLVDLPFGGAPLTASNSGFDAFKDGYNGKKGGAQYLHLGAAQSLAFVRARDSVPGVDIGRTQRQQAAIDYIIYHFKQQSILSDPGTISSMLTAAKSAIQVDQGFQLADFAPQMQSLTGKHLTMKTLPAAVTQGVDVPGLGANQDANYIYVPNLRQTVNNAFYGSAAVQPSKSVTVDVYNGSGTSGLAGTALSAFAAMGYTAGKTGNASAQSHQLTDDTQVFYGSGAQTNADSIAAIVGDSAGATADSALPAGHVEVLLGQKVIDMPAGLELFGAHTVTQNEFMTAAQQDGLPAADLTPALPNGTTTRGGTTGAATQSVSATAFGAQPAAASQPDAESQLAGLTSMMELAAGAQPGAAAQSAAKTPSTTYTGPKPSNVPAGIPCVY
jgi:anionic cell wall polymer biosynthesis LytR-Cps2A-Psr (LCP) family protein